MGKRVQKQRLATQQPGCDLAWLATQHARAQASRPPRACKPAAPPCLGVEMAAETHLTGWSCIETKEIHNPISTMGILKSRVVPRNGTRSNACSRALHDHESSNTPSRVQSREASCARQSDHHRSVHTAKNTNTADYTAIHAAPAQAHYAIIRQEAVIVCCTSCECGVTGHAASPKLTTSARRAWIQKKDKTAVRHRRKRSAHDYRDPRQPNSAERIIPNY